MVALLWMAKLLKDATAYKEAFMVVFLGTLGWCMPMMIQIFVLAAFIMLIVQWWEDAKPAFIVWCVAVATMFAVGGRDGFVRSLAGPSAEENAQVAPSSVQEP